MTEKNKIYEASIIIAARKNTFFNAFWGEYSKKISPNNIQSVHNIMVNIVSSLDNELFIGDKERQLKKIDPHATLKQLKLDTKKIEYEIIKKVQSSTMK